MNLESRIFAFSTPSKIVGVHTLWHPEYANLAGIPKDHDDNNEWQNLFGSTLAWNQVGFTYFPSNKRTQIPHNRWRVLKVIGDGSIKGTIDFIEGELDTSVKDRAYEEDTLRRLHKLQKDIKRKTVEAVKNLDWTTALEQIPPKAYIAFPDWMMDVHQQEDSPNIFAYQPEISLGAPATKPRKTTKKGKGGIQRVAREGLISLFAANISQDPNTNIEELISNGYDEDAPKVMVSINEKKQTLTIEDTGSGMSEDDLANFYGVGGSVKKANPLSPGGRVRLGKFGVGSLVLSALGTSYELVTTKDGITSVVKEEFPDGRIQEDVIIDPVVQETGFDSGTSITIQGINTKNINIQQLIRKIQWDLPIGRDDFRVVVNNRNVEPFKLTSDVKFTYELSSKHMGDVEIDMYVFRRKHTLAGANVYVHGRRVNHPEKKYGTDSFAHSMLLKDGLDGFVVGMIHADGLESAINMARSHLMPSHRGVQELNEHLRRIAKEVHNYAQDHVFIEEDQKEQTALERSQSYTVNILKAGNIEDVVDQVVLGESEGIGYYDEETGVVTLNAEDPRLKHIKGVSAKAIEERVLEMTIRVLADLYDDPVLYESQVFEAIAGKVVNKKRVNPVDRFHPNRLYTYQDAQELTGLHELDINYLRSREMLHYDDGKYLGKSLTEARDKVGECNISLNRFNQEALAGTPAKLEQIEGALSKTSNLDGLVFALDEGCYFVNPSFTGVLKKVVTSPEFNKKGRGVKDYQRMFDEVLDAEYTASQVRKLVPDASVSKGTKYTLRQVLAA